MNIHDLITNTEHPLTCLKPRAQSYNARSTGKWNTPGMGWQLSTRRHGIYIWTDFVAGAMDPIIQMSWLTCLNMIKLDQRTIKQVPFTSAISGMRGMRWESHIKPIHHRGYFAAWREVNCMFSFQFHGRKTSSEAHSSKVTKGHSSHLLHPPKCQLGSLSRQSRLR